MIIADETFVIEYCSFRWKLGTNEEQKKLKKKRRTMKQWAFSFYLGFLKSREYILVYALKQLVYWVELVDYNGWNEERK